MMTGYIWAVLWFVLAAYLFYMGFKRSKTFFIAAPFFVFLGGWALADIFLEQNLMEGIYGWIYRGVALVVLVIYLAVYFKYKRDGRGGAE